jgi:hypothetical protein
MRAFVSKLGDPARSRAALREFAAPGADIRPMRWTTFQRVETLCRYPGADALDCYEIEAIHETTTSGYTFWSRYEVCWRGDQIQRVERLEGGAWGG